MAQDVVQQRVAGRRTHNTKFVVRMPCVWWKGLVRPVTHHVRQAYSALVMSAPQIIAGAIILGRDWDPDVCDKPLGLWCAVSLMLLAFMTSCAWLLYKGSHPDPTQQSAGARFARAFSYPLDVFSLFW